MKDKPAVSIVIPVYNRPDILKRVSWSTYIYYRNHGGSATDGFIKNNASI